MSRIACFLVPLFALAARLRSEPDLLTEAVIITEGNGNAAHVVAATRRARKEGIVSGMTLPQARALMPKLIARGRDAECERTAQEALLDVAEGFSPRIEDAGEGMVFLDVSGLERHFAQGNLQPDALPAAAPHERNLGQAAIRSIATIGMPARVGIAASKLAARVAAELPHSPNIVPSGNEATFLAPLPLGRLMPELQAAQTLSSWGINSIGELARLPESEVASRLGETGRDLHWAARGVDPKPLMPRQLPPEFREAMELEWPLVTLEPFLFVANAALDRLSRRLEMQGLACKRLELTLKLEPDGFHSRAIELPAPTRDVKTMLTLTRLDLEAHSPGAPVAGFIFVAHADRPRRAQLSLFGPTALSPDKLATTIARLAALLGADRVGMPICVDGHAPERHALQPFDPPPPPDMKRKPRKGRGLLSVRVLRPSVELEVISTSQYLGSQDVDHLAEGDFSYATGNCLLSVRSVTPNENGKKPLIQGDVRVAAGPWQLEEGWWSDTPIERDYWDVELAGGGLYRIYRERKTGDWFADGVYD